TIVLMAVAIAINIAVGNTVQNVIRLPLYLDSIGTVVVGVLCGPVAGAVTGIAANLIWGLTIGPTSIIPFAVVAGVIGLLAGLFGRRRIFSARGRARSWGLVAVAGVVTGVVAAVLSAPIAYVLFTGVTGSGTDALVAFFRGTLDNALAATFAQGIVSDPLDKLVTFLVAYAILLAVPATVKTTFPQGERTL
ncbi:MAG TPA: ECF transporter S component, partial [Actinomycetota bacterium]|nr:ECF transporter S component [Actinomycetota bacterium]